MRRLVSRLRRFLLLIRTIDPIAIGNLISDFEARQRKLEQSHNDIQKMLISVREKLDEARILPNAKINLIRNLDVKNLGYELGRLLAEKNLLQRPAKVDHQRLQSKLCVQDDFTADWLLYWCRELRAAPIYHRKLWELCYVAQALFSEGQLAPGRRGLGFGCGEEPLPSLFAKYGALVVATDLDRDRPEAEVWRLTAQHASTIDSIRRPDICPDQERLANIEFRSVDMNAIPREFDGQFDFCWSACALEHLGSLEKGLTFIESSMRTLKPGGIAVHTTEFTLDDGPTIDNHPIVLYQQSHLEMLAERLRTAGHEVAGFDFSTGHGVLDRFVDLPPYCDNALIAPQQYAHLKLLLDGYTCTSIGLIIKARAGNL